MRIRYWSSDVCSSDLAEEEARLAVLGCHILLEPGDGPALIFDIGGGSTELVLVDTEGPAPPILDWQSATSEERRVGQERGSTCRSRLYTQHEKKHNITIHIPRQTH